MNGEYFRVSLAPRWLLFSIVMDAFFQTSWHEFSCTENKKKIKKFDWWATVEQLFESKSSVHQGGRIYLTILSCKHGISTN